MINSMWSSLQVNKVKHNETSHENDVNDTEKQARIFGVVSLDELQDMEMQRKVLSGIR